MVGQKHRCGCPGTIYTYYDPCLSDEYVLSKETGFSKDCMHYLLYHIPQGLSFSAAVNYLIETRERNVHLFQKATETSSKGDITQYFGMIPPPQSLPVVVSMVPSKNYLITGFVRYVEQNIDESWSKVSEYRSYI